MRIKLPVYNTTTKPPIIYETPDVPPDHEIDGYELPKKDQKFRRWKYPNDKEFDQLTPKQQDDILDYVLSKRANGHWFYNNGVKTYITNVHWFYLNFWKLDIGPPEYRASDRDYFYFWDICVKDAKCYGMADMENRRGGKTERANVIQYEHISKTPNTRGGTQSKTDTDAKKVFSKLVRAWKRLPYWLKPLDEGESQPKSALRFFEPSKRDTKSKKKSYGVALDSYIDFETALEEAYDGEKLHRYTSDESGKTTKANVADRLDIVKECFVVGEDIIGKMLFTTTVEEMEKKGGKNFKLIWDNSDMDVRDENGQTKSGLYPFFKPAWYCFEGFIDEYGNSVHETPAKPIMGNKGKLITIGSKEFLERKRRGKDGKSLASEKRKYPFCEEDAFGVIAGAIFEDDVVEKLKYANEQVVEENTPINYVKMVEINGVIVAKPVSSKEEGCVKMLENVEKDVKYSMGIDPTLTDKDTGSDDGSDYAAVVTKGLGSADMKMFCPTIAYSERPQRKETCYHKIYLLAKYIIQEGGKLEIVGEINGSGADCFAYLVNRGLKQYMTGTPKEYSNSDAGTKHGKYWLYVNGDVLDRLHGIGNRFMRLYGENFRLPSVTSSLLNYGMDNEDEASAFLISLFNFRDFDKVVVKKSRPKPPRLIWNDRTKRYEYENEDKRWDAAYQEKRPTEN